MKGLLFGLVFLVLVVGVVAVEPFNVNLVKSEFTGKNVRVNAWFSGISEDLRLDAWCVHNGTTYWVGSESYVMPSKKSVSKNTFRISGSDTLCKRYDLAWITVDGVNVSDVVEIKPHHSNWKPEVVVVPPVVPVDDRYDDWLECRRDAGEWFLCHWFTKNAFKIYVHKLKLCDKMYGDD
jgi:hypothetical protein